MPPPTTESVTVTPQVPGRIVERHFQDGAQLTKGQLLFTVDPRPYQAQVNSAKAQLAEARAALDLAATQLKMYSSITDERAVSALDRIDGRLFGGDPDIHEEI